MSRPRHTARHLRRLSDRYAPTSTPPVVDGRPPKSHPGACVDPGATSAHRGGATASRPRPGTQPRPPGRARPSPRGPGITLAQASRMTGKARGLRAGGRFMHHALIMLLDCRCSLPSSGLAVYACPKGLRVLSCSFLPWSGSPSSPVQAVHRRPHPPRSRWRSRLQAPDRQPPRWPPRQVRHPRPSRAPVQPPQRPSRSSMRRWRMQPRG